ncbi:MAG: methyltransferase domain-containing protein [Sphingomonadaceae bacterium]
MNRQRSSKPAAIPGEPARLAAMRLLDAVLRRGETLDQAEKAALRDLAGAADKGLARALAGEVLRWMTDLDALIDSAMQQPLPEDAKPRMVLRLMLAGWLRLETPPHAVIATGLPLLSGGPRRLAHGVFSTLVKQEPQLPPVPTLPARVAERWGERTQDIATGLIAPPPLDLALRDAEQTAHWAEQLGGVSLRPGHLRLPRGERVEDLPGYREGAWWVQDLAAQLPASLLGAGEGKRVLDLCAAPGGKTMALAAAGWQVTALDISQRRSERMRRNLARTGLEAEVVVADAFKWEPEMPFDAILLDAPCTATGTCRRHPDVLHRIGARQIEEMAELQAALLERAIGWLKPGGVLVYAVCSLEAAEGEAQAESVALTRSPIRAEELPAGLAPMAEGWLRTHPGQLPDQGGLDGFFIARWVKG